MYSSGDKIWNANHAIMANGSGILGDPSASQGMIFARQPGSSSLYYFFYTNPNNPNNSTLSYSIIDLTLAAGLGSVVTKNQVLINNFDTEMLAGVRHCNGQDVWIVAHPAVSGSFFSFLLSSVGISTNPVVSTVGEDTVAHRGQLKFSPNGRKIAIPIDYAGTVRKLAVHDFDNSTGTVSSNSLVTTGNFTQYAYGVEFSPDGTKIYMSNATSSTPLLLHLAQWDLCAGTQQAINSSCVKIYTSSTTALASLQIGIDGKIYLAVGSSSFVGVINSPNNYGSNCSFSLNGISIAPSVNNWGLQNFVVEPAYPPPSPFAYTINCGDVSFAAFNSTNPACATSLSITSCSWNFGDNSTSSSLFPVHSYSAPGSYSCLLTLNYPCSTATMQQIVNVTAVAPTFSVSGKTDFCKGESTTLTTSPAFNYSWTGVGSGTTAVINPTSSGIYTVTATNGNTCATTKTIQINVKACLGEGFLSTIDPFIEMFPNPASDIIRISFDSENGIRYIITDISGREVLAEEKLQTDREIRISSLQSGVYFLKIKSGHYEQVLKFCKD
jgi:hypothetical protein